MDFEMILKTPDRQQTRTSGLLIDVMSRPRGLGRMKGSKQGLTP
jgi:hypothetical protein